MDQCCSVTCEESQRLLASAVDRELSQGQSERLREHHEQCPACEAELQFEEALDRHVRARLREVRVPERLRATISAMLAVEARLNA